MSTADIQTEFAPQQIVCLETGDRRLYGAIIQFIEQQRSYWLRPLCLVQPRDAQLDIISLHRTSDVIIRRDKVREAWDTEILEFWSALYDDSGDYQDNVAGRAQLHQFLQDFVW